MESGVQMKRPFPAARIGLFGLTVCLLAQTSWAAAVEVIVKYGGSGKELTGFGNDAT
jgi:hypothetical protein